MFKEAAILLRDGRLPEQKNRLFISKETTILFHVIMYVFVSMEAVLCWESQTNTFFWKSLSPLPTPHRNQMAALYPS